MDIFAYADSINWLADYYDFHTGYIYGIQEAKESNRNKMNVYELVDNQKVFIGVVRREE